MRAVAATGVRDLSRPDFGDPPEILAGQLPVFWACGVTPQVALESAKPPICITHYPGSLLITDNLNLSLAALQRPARHLRQPRYKQMSIGAPAALASRAVMPEQCVSATGQPATPSAHQPFLLGRRFPIRMFDRRKWGAARP
jgi:hypothetical protein